MELFAPKVKETKLFEQNSHEQEVLAQFRLGGEVALASFFDDYRSQLRQLIRLRMDHRIGRRLDDSDIIQEAFLESCARLQTYLECPHIPPACWIRRLARQVVARIQREHLGTKKRDVRREAYGAELLPIDLLELSDAMTPPDARVASMEFQQRISKIIQTMTPLEREIITLIHVEGLTVRDAALEIGINLEAAKKRYRRAINRLRKMTPQSPSACY